MVQDVHRKLGAVMLSFVHVAKLVPEILSVRRGTALWMDVEILLVMPNQIVLAI